MKFPLYYLEHLLLNLLKPIRYVEPIYELFKPIVLPSYLNNEGKIDMKVLLTEMLMDRLQASPDRIILFIENLVHIKRSLLWKPPDPFNEAVDELLTEWAVELYEAFPLTQKQKGICELYGFYSPDLPGDYCEHEKSSFVGRITESLCQNMDFIGYGLRALDFNPKAFHEQNRRLFLDMHFLILDLPENERKPTLIFPWSRYLEFEVAGCQKYWIYLNLRRYQCFLNRHPSTSSTFKVLLNFTQTYRAYFDRKYYQRKLTKLFHRGDKLF